MEPLEPKPFSGRLKNAVVADRVMDPNEDDPGYWLTRTQDGYASTGHFARQLGFVEEGRYLTGLHDTLGMILEEIDGWLRTWPPPSDANACRPIVHEATKHLRPRERYDMLMWGPSRWRQHAITTCKVERLDQQFQDILERALAGEVSSVLERWIRWDIPQLAARRRELMAAAAQERERAEREANFGTRPPPSRYTRPTDPDRAKRISQDFTPRGRT